MANLRADNLTGTGGRNAIDGSLFFDGSSKLSVPNSADVRLGSNDFTIEAWIKVGNAAGDWEAILGMWDSSNTRRTYTLQRKNSDGELYLYVSTDGGSTNWAFANGGNVTVGDWHHVAGVRDGNTLRVYLNGVEVDNSSYSGTIYNNTTDALFIGDVETTDTSNFNGYISNARLVNGTCLYPSGTTFTPPTQKLTTVANTQVLACQDSDNALQEATGKTITGYGRYTNTDTELVTNHSFNNGTTGWTLSDASEGSMAVVNGSLVLTNDDTNDPPVYAWQAVTLVVGQTYDLKVHFSGGTGTPGSNLAIYLNTSSSFGSSAGGSMTADSVSGNGIKIHRFKATVATTYLILRVNANAAGTSIFSAASMKASDYGKAPKVLPPVGIDEGVVVDGYTKINSPGVMYFPTGDTAQRGRGRAVMGGFYKGPNTYYTNIEYLSIQSLGNTIKFGDLTLARTEIAACSSSTRALFAGGTVPGPVTGGTKQNIIDYVTIATTANAINFGDLTDTIRTLGGCSNETRGIFAGGIDDPARLATIDYVTIASTGDGADFGDLTEARRNISAHSSTTRGIFAGGLNPGPAYVNTIDYITIATTGDATNFGDLTALVYATTSCSNSTRGVIMGGTNPSGATNVINYVTIATTGDAVDFGDITVARADGAGVASPTRGLMIGGETPSNDYNTIDYVTIATTGNASDFGDASVGESRGQAGSSDCHGGLS